MMSYNEKKVLLMMRLQQLQTTYQMLLNEQPILDMDYVTSEIEKAERELDELNKEEKDEFNAAVPSIVSGLKQMLGLPEDITLAELRAHNEDTRAQWLLGMGERIRREKAKDAILAMEIANARKEEKRRDKLC